MILEASVFKSIVDFVTKTAKNIGFNWITIISFILLLLTIIISFVCIMFSIDSKTSKAVQKINLYLERNPYINEENLVEFNKLMKTIPAPMRVQWQQYMVGRNKKPSAYFTDENCIDKPFKSSSYASHVVAVKVATICISIFSFIFCASALEEANLGQVLLQSLLTSGMIAILGSIYVLFLKSRRNSMLYGLYYDFTNLKNYLDRAVTTLPDYVDYEILFTKKEIVAGIPVLQEYLKQRAEYEQEQIEHAKASQVEHEQYDFSQLGVDATIIMEKAMRECEYMLGNKKRILSEISELQSNLESFERTYNEKNKGTQRKLRDIQESLDRLKEKLQTTTNMIVGNDLRKQRENEIEKQRQIEKESAEDTRKFEATKKEIMDQIAAKKEEIESFRKNAEAVLIDEFKAYSTKIYNELKKIADDQVKEELDTAHHNIQTLQEELDDKEKVLVEKTTLLNEQMEVEQYANDLQNNYEELRVAYEDMQKELLAKEQEIDELMARAQQEPQYQNFENLADKNEEPEVYPEPVESAFDEKELFADEVKEEPKEEPVVEEPKEEPAEEIKEPELPKEEPVVEEKPAEDADEEKQLKDVQDILKSIVAENEPKKKTTRKKAAPKAEGEEKPKKVKKTIKRVENKPWSEVIVEDDKSASKPKTKKNKTSK